MGLIFHNKTTKVQQLTDFIQGAIVSQELRAGDKLPSINYMSSEYNVSRDTVFKAFLKLKERGLIDSIHGKNYYVSNLSTNILLVLDEYSPFKEALYNSLVKKLPSTYKVDLWFHQYNKNLFDTIINESYGRYNKYIVMNYDNEKFSETLEKIEKGRLLLLDFGKFDKKEYSYVCQDFDEGFYDALLSAHQELLKYNQLVFILNKHHKHPQSSVDYFTKFCNDHNPTRYHRRYHRRQLLHCHQANRCGGSHQTKQIEGVANGQGFRIDRLQRRPVLRSNRQRIAVHKHRFQAFGRTGRRVCTKRQENKKISPY